MRQGAGGGNQTDQTTNFFWGLILIIGLAILFWFYDHSAITRFLFWVRLGEIKVMLWLAYIINGMTDVLGLPHLQLARLMAWHAYIANHLASTKSVPFARVVGASLEVGAWIRFPIAIILFGAGLYLYFGHGRGRYTRTYNMTALRKDGADNWPQITPVLEVDLSKTPLSKGPWAMSQLPLDYCKQYNLLRVVKDAKTGQETYDVLRGNAHRILVMQLGPLWKGLMSLPIHVQALAVIFIARAEGQREIADKFLTQIAASSGSGKLNFAGIREQALKYQNSRIIKWLEPRHAYVTTLMATLLEMARADGVLASAEFLWLKPVDRRMWYTLNSVGRQTSVVEVSGIFAHWLAERKVGFAMKVPMVREAVTALAVAVAEILYIAEGDEWQEHSAA